VALTKLWFSRSGGDRQDDTGTLIATNTAPNGETFGWLGWGSPFRVTIGSYTYEQNATYSYEYFRPTISFTTTETIVAGTIFRFDIGPRTSISAPLPADLLAGTHTFRMVMWNDVGQGSGICWGAGFSNTDGDLVLDLASVAPAGKPVHLFRTKIISPSVQGSY
jgi:hypothetical protein